MSKDLHNRIKKYLPEPKTKKKTFLDYINTSNKETVMAEMLAFFFDSRKPHELGDSFLQALLNTPYSFFDEKRREGETLRERINIPEEGLKIEEVCTEDTTSGNKRIDILIKAQDLIIAIEFKINHHLDNPLCDYMNFIEKKYADKKEKLYLILTPYWKEPEGAANPEKKDDKEKVKHFKQVMLNHFRENIEKISRSVSLPSEENLKYHVFLQDFLQTIKNRRLTHEYIDECIRIHNSNEKMIRDQSVLKEINSIYAELKGLTVEDENIHNEHLLNTLTNLENSKKLFETKAEELKRKALDGYTTVKSNITELKLNHALEKEYDQMKIKIRLGLNGWTLEAWKKDEKKDGEKIKKETGKNFYARPQEIAAEVKEFEEEQLQKLTHA